MKSTSTAIAALLSWCCHHKHARRFLLVGCIFLLTCINNIFHVLDLLHGHVDNSQGLEDAVAYLPPPPAEPEPKKTTSSTNATGSVQQQTRKYKNRVYTTKSTPAQLLIKRDDYIYKPNKKSMRWDASPIVIEKYKLIFFTVPKVASTTFKQLFRKMMNFTNWSEQSSESLLPHSPYTNGLQYLAYYPIEEANKLLTDPTYTKAIFVRDPKQRFLSAFLDKALSNDGSHVVKHCCHSNQHCLNQISVPYGFLTMIQQGCPDEHWIQQTSRMEQKYWSLINFVGHFETMQDDTKRLLQKIGAWKDHGITGWGPYNNWSIFERPKQHSNTKLVVHSTDANKQYWWWTPLLESYVEEYYTVDYQNPVLNFTKTTLSKPRPGDESKKKKKKKKKLTLEQVQLQQQQQQQQQESSSKSKQLLQIDPTDYIYRNDAWSWDASPVVIEEYKLLFFTIPNLDCVVWKKLFRRMMGYTDWKYDNSTTMIPHNPEYNGLKYLHNYSLDVAQDMMTSNQWTRAIFVQDPKQRFLTTFAKKAITNNGNYVITKCCKQTRDCIKRNKNINPHDFLSIIQKGRPGSSNNNNNNGKGGICSGSSGATSGGDDDNTNEVCWNDPAWSPQNERMEAKYWKYINFVGHYETLYDDSYRLLTKLGAWQKYGQSGWGKDGTNRIFDRRTKPRDVMTVLHEHLHWYDAVLEFRVEQYYDGDYMNPLFNFTKQLKMSYTAIKPSSVTSSGLLSNQTTTTTVDDATLTTGGGNNNGLLVRPTDFIYRGGKGIWDSAPVVVEQYKLVFFTIQGVGDATFKQLFRKMEGKVDWSTLSKNDQYTWLPHDPNLNGLKYLNHFSLQRASEIMESTEWTKAVFVRDPKSRFVASFIDQAVNHDGYYVGRKCCDYDNDEEYGNDDDEEEDVQVPIDVFSNTPSATASCVTKARTSEGFFDLIQTCKDSYWEPQHLRMESKYWPYINFIGHYESIQDDSRRLLQQIGAWDTHGVSGWGSNGDLSIFQKVDEEGNNGELANPLDNMGKETIAECLPPTLERRVEEYYAEDYINAIFKFSKTT